MEDLHNFYRSHCVRKALPSGGKAGKGHNKTSTVQVLNYSGSQLLKSFRFNVGNSISEARAFAKARAYVDEKTSK